MGPVTVDASTTAAKTPQPDLSLCRGAYTLSSAISYDPSRRRTGVKGLALRF